MFLTEDRRATMSELFDEAIKECCVLFLVFFGFSWVHFCETTMTPLLRRVVLLLVTLALLLPVLAHKSMDNHAPRPFLRGGRGLEVQQRVRELLAGLPAGARVPSIKAHLRVMHSVPPSQVPVILTAEPASAVSGQDVIVPLAGMTPAPGPLDFVAIYSPPYAQALGPMDFLDMLNVTSADTNGELVYELANMRADYQFGYFRVASDSSVPVLVGLSNIVTLADKLVPAHVHLAIARDEVSVVVQWTGAPGTCSTAQVGYGLSETGEDWGAVGPDAPPSSYNASMMCGEVANITAQTYYRDPGLLFRATLSNLVPGSRYFYRVRCAEGQTKVFTFRAPRVAGDPTTTRFIAYADHGLDGGNAATSTVARVLSDFAGPEPFDDFVLHFGDISYSRGQGYMLDQYLDLIEPIAGRAPYMVSIGNHEWDFSSSSSSSSSFGYKGWHPSWGNMGDDSHGECGVPTFYQFHMPGNFDLKFWYTFRYGLVQVVQMSSEHDWTVGSEQYSWLQATLSSVDRNLTPWVLLTSHRPMYTSETLEEGDFKVSLHMQANLEDLIQRYGVDVMLTGHYHSMERTCPVFKQVCQPAGNATIHACVGTAGANLEEGSFPSKFHWSVSHANAFGYSRFTATPTTLKYDFILNQDGSLYDTFTITKPI
jgi:hypothetical protein